LVESLGVACRARLAALAAELTRELAYELGGEKAWRMRHVLRAIEQVAMLTGSRHLDAAVVRQARHRLATAEAEGRAAHEHSLVLLSDHGGIELAPLIGTKAANLGEMERILGPARVPRWTAVTARALSRMLDQRVGRAGTLGAALRRALTRPNVPVGRQADDIARLWAEVELPASLRAGIVEAYQGICAETPAAPVAVRSSAFEEDSERQPWAGQFATFLGVRGEEAVIEHVRRVWASLWGPSVLARRRQMGMPPDAPVASGVVLQRMARARVSGVIFTASPAAGAKQMVLNVGLWLGEGVVSGLSEVDLVLIDRPSQPDRPLHLEYKVADKRHSVVLAPQSPNGTQVAEVSYHRRFRPALESVEIEELVVAALQLENAFRHPLDIEFAFEGADLRILQARPVPVFHASLTSPLLGQAARKGSSQGGPS
jgi:phosphoenolpyruvate synthase/pyruvate phosphate dikinase